MPETAAPAESGAPKSLAARALGVLFSPRATYADVAAHPRWFGIFLLVVLVAGGAATVFTATEVGQRAILDQQLAQAQASNRQMTQQQIDMLERMTPYYKYFSLPLQALFLGIGSLVISGLVVAVFNAMMGGNASFRQVFSTVIHSGVVLGVGGLFTLPLDYVRETMTSPTNLMVFLPFLEEDTFPARLFGAIDLFYIWWVVSLAIGLGVLYKRKTGPIASTLLGIYVLLAIVIAGVRTALAGA